MKGNICDINICIDYQVFFNTITKQ